MALSEWLTKQLHDLFRCSELRPIELDGSW